MSEKSNEKKHTHAAENIRKAEIRATTNLLRKPLLSLLSGAEPGEDKREELDRWWTLEGVSNVSAEKLQDISECFSTLAKRSAAHVE